MHSVLLGKREGKSTLRRPRRRRVNNIKMFLWEVRRGGDRMELAQVGNRWRAFVNTVMNFVVT